jgi:hypothetical protein
MLLYSLSPESPRLRVEIPQSEVQQRRSCPQWGVRSKAPFSIETQEVSENQKAFLFFISHQVLFPVSKRDFWEVSDLKSSENWQTANRQKKPRNPELEKQTEACPCPCPWSASTHTASCVTCPRAGLENQDPQELRPSQAEAHWGLGAPWAEVQQRAPWGEHMPRGLLH